VAQADSRAMVASRVKLREGDAFSFMVGLEWIASFDFR
jgi:hypothetical protein